MNECKLYSKTIIGPVDSHLLGNSLGINLLPQANKVCNFNCIYCEYGWTDRRKTSSATFPDRLRIRKEFAEILKELRLIDKLPDTIAFTGNGESTLHPHFAEIMEDVIALRNKYSPGSRIIAFTNGTLLNRKEIVKALQMADQIVVKLDAGTEEDYNAIDQPLIRRSLDWICEHLKYFNSKVTIQSFFLRGFHNGNYIDNTAPKSVDLCVNRINEIKPEMVMIYTINGSTAAENLEKIESDILHEIAEKIEDLGIKTQVN